MNDHDPRFWNTHDEALAGADRASARAPEQRKHMSYSDWLEVQVGAHAEFGERVELVVDWSAPTPDADWNVRALVSHVIEEQQWVPLLLAGRTVGEARSRLGPLGTDLVAEWQRYSTAATRAWASVEPTAKVNLSYDTVPASAYLREQASDVIVHTWDLSRAIGANERLGDSLVAAAWTVFEPQKDTLEASGLFASPVPIPADASLQSRLLALTGRDDRLTT